MLDQPDRQHLRMGCEYDCVLLPPCEKLYRSLGTNNDNSLECSYKKFKEKKEQNESTSNCNAKQTIGMKHYSVNLTTTSTKFQINLPGVQAVDIGCFTFAIQAKYWRRERTSVLRW